jgi:N utilization substance protein B
MAKASSGRRVARETALRVLYTIDVGRQPVEEVLTETVAAHELDEAGAAFVRSLVTSVLDNRRELDKAIDRVAVGFPTIRQTAVDRNILRLATSEILHPSPDTPAGVVVNEAVELAKKYSTAESGKFVNGVLGALVRESTPTTPTQPDREPAPLPEELQVESDSKPQPSEAE